MFYGRVIVRRLAHRQDALIAVSNNTASDIHRFFGLPAQRITTIPNGIDHSRFCPVEREAARLAFSQRAQLSRRFFLYVARPEHPRKHRVGWLAAFEDL